MVEPDRSQGASPDDTLQSTGASSTDATSESTQPTGDSTGAAAGAPGPTPTDYVPDNDTDTSAVADDAAEGSSDEDSIEDELDDEEDSPFVHAEPLEFIDESISDSDLKFEWYILKVQVNREDSIKAALLRRINMNGLERFFKEVVVPTEDVAEFTKTGKRRVVKKKIYPGYILVNMVFNDETWFIVRETSGIGDFTGAMGKPTPMDPKDVERILRSSKMLEEDTNQVRTAIPFKTGDRVRVKEGYFQNFEGDIDGIDQANGRVTVMINIFGRSTPVELEHWQIEAV